MRRGKLSFILLFIAAVGLLFPALAAKADSVTDTVSVYIGYFGWDEDQFVEKSTYHWRDLDDMFGGALTTHELVYSYYSGSRTYLVAARGFYIRDLLEYAGIDFGSISRIDFFTMDQTVGAYRSFTKSSLFDMQRYYFPNLAADIDTGEIYPYYGDDIYDGAVRVEPMLALEDYTEWDSVGLLFDELYDSTMFSASSRFHLFFGQLSPSEANTSSAAKYVYKLFITFSGTPVLSTDMTNIDLKVGSDFTMNLGISAEDSLLDDYVRANIVWSSDNEAVVSVDGVGALDVKSEGEAVITAAFGASSVSVSINVSGEEADDEQAHESEGEDPPGYGAAQSAQEGDGLFSEAGTGIDEIAGSPQEGNDFSSAASGEESNQEDNEVIDTQDATDISDATETENVTETTDITDAPDTPDAANTPEITVAQYIPEATDENEDIPLADDSRIVYMLSAESISREDFREWAGSILSNRNIDNSGEGALLNARREGMDEDSEQLILHIEGEKSFMAATAFALGIFFATGFAYGVVSYRRKF